MATEGNAHSESVCSRQAAIIQIVLGIFIILMDPFGFASATKSFTQGVTTRFFAPNYPADGQRHVTAVYIDDTAAEAIDRRYPLSFPAHGRVLKRILCLDPAAIFIDINFRYLRDSQEDLDALVDALRYRMTPQGCAPLSDEQLEAPGVAPVYVAIIRGGNADCASWLTAQETCGDLVALRALGRVARPIDITTIIDAGHGYDVSLPDPEGGRTSASPALALARAVCERSADKPPGCSTLASVSADPLVLRWGYYLSPQTLSGTATGDCDATPSASASFWSRQVTAIRVTANDFLSSVSGWRARYIQPCPYSDQVSAAALLAPGAAGDPALADAVRNRAVVYGAWITALPDTIVSPVHGRIAGLHAHAMATDNLLTLGASYWREPPRLAWHWDWMDIIDIGLVILLAALTYFHASASALFVALWLLLTPLALLAMALVSSSLGYTPVNAALLSAQVLAYLPCIRRNR